MTYANITRGIRSIVQNSSSYVTTLSHNLLQLIHLATNNLKILKCDVKSVLHSEGQATVTILKRDHMQNPHHGEMKKYVDRPQLDSCKA